MHLRRFSITRALAALAFALAGPLHAEFPSKLPGTVDPTFRVTSVTGRYRGRVRTFAVRPDGKVIIGGIFNEVANQPHLNIARLNADSSVDNTFNPVLNPTAFIVSGVAVQADGRILLCGDFTTVNGTARGRIARLDFDGSVDSTFAPSGADSDVNCLALQPDGKVLLGGAFLLVNGVPRRGIARLNTDGSVDTTFTPGSGTNSTVKCLAVQTDGKILIGGDFNDVAGTGHVGIARLNANGSVDSSFATFTNNEVDCVAVQPDKKIVLGGFFTTVNGQPRNHIARLKSDGSLESTSTFNPGTGANGYVYRMATQADGGILLAGNFTQVNGLQHSHCARLNANGSVDTAFVANTDGTVEAVALQADGRVLIGGPFGTVNGKYRFGIARLYNGFGSLTVSLDGPTHVRWQRGGSSPEVGQMTFYSGYGAGQYWTALGSGTRVAGGWELTGLSLPASGYIRVSGSGDGQYNGSSGIFEQYLAYPPQAPIPVTLPASDLSSTSGTLNGTGNAPKTSTEVSFEYGLTTSYGSSVSAEPQPPGYSSENPGSAVVTDLAPNTTYHCRVKAVNAGGTAFGDDVVFTTFPAGRLDAGFDPGFIAGAFDYVDAFALAPDGAIVIGGSFTTVAGIPRNNFARLDASGSLDIAFDIGAGASGDVETVAMQPDAQIVITGAFTTVNGFARNRIGRLNPDGSVEGTATFNPGSGANGFVYSTVVQSDGKILIGGPFTTVDGQPRGGIARLNADGSVESTATFNPGTGANGGVTTVAIQQDGKILLGGSFTSVNGQSRARIARLNPDGSVENTSTFNPGTGANNGVYCLAVQADGKIVLGGDFTALNGLTRNRIARLNADGSVESASTFNSGSGANGTIWSVGLQADGKIVLGGDFTILNGLTRTRIARLTATGAVESTASFDAGSGTESTVFGVAVQADGKIILGGGFTTVNTLAHSRIARLDNDPAIQSLTVPSSNRVQWLRGGSSPETQQVSFELSTDAGGTWTTLGLGTRIAGGWERAGLALPSRGQIRGRARTSGGSFNGSSGLVETIAVFSPDADGDGLLDSWELTHWPSIADYGAEDDPDGDGLNDLEELAFGLNPNLPDSALAPRPVAEGGYLTITVTKHAGVTYEGQSAGSLLTDELDSFDVATTTVLINNSATLKVRDNILIGTPPARFLRVKVTAAP